MSDVLTPDLCILGGGTAGLAAADEALRRGLRTVLVEPEMAGGWAHKVGLPRDIVRAAGAAAQAMRDVASVGLAPREPRVEWATIASRIRDMTIAQAPLVSPARYKALGVTIIEAAGRFTGPRTIVAGERTVTARRILVANGAETVAPSITGLETVRWLTPSTLFDLDALPPHLLVLGRGAETVLIAQCLRRLGTLVTIVADGPLLPGEDPEMTALLRAALVREKVEIRQATVTSIEPGGSGSVRLIVDTGGRPDALVGSHLLIADAHQPRVAALNLERAGVKYDRNGISVSPWLRTSNRRIFAAGDVVGACPSLENAARAAQAAVRNATVRLPNRFDATAIPRLIDTDPPLAAVGLDEAAAREKYRSIRILRAAFSDVAQTHAKGSPAGHIKVVASERGRVLGAAVVGRDAGEVITLWTLAVRGRLTLADIADVPIPDAALSAISRNAAQHFAKITHGAGARRSWSVQRGVP